MPNKQPPATSSRRNIEAGPGPRAPWAIASALVALAVAGGYLGLYRAKGFRLPVGFDAPWYVWRASFLTAHGMGPLGTSTRPGSAVLAAVLGSLTGRSQFTMAVLLGPVLAGIFALTLGALVWSSMAQDRLRWLAAVVLGGTVLGGTRLVDENVATLLFLCLVVAALVPLVAAAAGSGPRWAFVGSVVLLVAAGLAHWLFLAVFGVMLAGAVILLVPRSLRQRSEGLALPRTEAGTLASAGAATGAVMALAVFGLLRAPANTIQLKEDPQRFVPKLANDATRLRLWLVGPVAALGAWASVASEHTRSRRKAVLLALLGAWSVVALGGIVLGVVTKKLPPHRFLELLVVVPGVVAMVEAVSWLAGLVRRRSGPRLGWAVAVVATVVLAVPGVSAWYASGAPKPWVSAEALQQVRTAAAWVGTLRPGQPFVVWVDPFGSAGALSPALKERTIRAALPADLQARFHMVAGTLLDDLVSAPLGGPFGSGLSPAMRTAVLPYWRDARPFLVGGAPVVVLRALDPPDFEAARRADIAFPIGSGTIAIRNDRGRGPARSFVGAPQPDAFPGAIRAALWSIGLLALLMAAGLGWTRALLGRGPDPRVVFGLAPALGAAALVIVGTASSRLGMSLGGQTAWIVWALTTVGGFAAAALAGRDGKEDLPTPPDVGSNDG